MVMLAAELARLASAAGSHLVKVKVITQFYHQTVFLPDASDIYPSAETLQPQGSD